MEQLAVIREGERADLRRQVQILTADPEWLGGVAVAITDAIHAELPELDLDQGFRARTHASTESVLRTFVEMAIAGQDPGEAEPPPAAVDYAREFVRRGIPLGSLLRTYYIGHATYFRIWVSRLRQIVEDPAELNRAIEEGATWTFTYVEALSRKLVQRYAHERDRWVRSAAAARAEVVRSLLAREHIGLGQAESQLGYRLGRTHLAFLVWGDEADSRRGDLGVIERVAAEVAGSQSASQPLLVPLGAHMVAGWIGGEGLPGPAELEATRSEGMAAAGLHLAFGSPAEGLEGFRRSHVQANHARRVAMLLPGARPGSVSVYERVALTALASADLDHARDFVAAELGPLASDDSTARRLAATLMVYLEERSSPKRTAERLGVHENTIPNRIRAAQDLLARPIQERTPELLVALRLRPLVATKADDG